MNPEPLTLPGARQRWAQLGFSALATVMLANLQYGWTLFVEPMHDAHQWSRAAIQVAFTILIFVNTWLAPVEGWLADRYGPRPVVVVGGFCAALSWVMNSRAESLPTLYVSAVIGGVALGCVFGTCMGGALKWFPDRRGLAAGVIAGGYGLGSAFTAAPLSLAIRSHGYRYAFFSFGLVQGIAIVVLGLLLVEPVALAMPRKQSRVECEFTPSQTIRTGVFWMTYAVYLLIAFGGMVLTAQLGTIARDFALTAPVLTLAVSLDNLANGLTRPIAGVISDAIGRENMMLLMFTLEALALLGLALMGRNPYAFVIFAALSFLFWGEIFVIFPAICGDSFGVGHATANNGLLYTAKGVSAVAVPLASMLVAYTGTWNSVLLTAALSSLLAGALAKFLLAPMRRRLAESSVKPVPAN